MSEWEKYQLMVLHELERNSHLIEKMSEKIENINSELEIVKLKSSIFGSISGMITIFAVNMFDHFKV